MNKTKLLEIAHALDLGSIDDKKAQTLLLGLLGVVGQSEQLPCDYCGETKPLKYCQDCWDKLEQFKQCY
jgi:hypothetical protein